MSLESALFLFFMFSLSVLSCCICYVIARPLNRLIIEGGLVVYRGRFWKKWSIERSKIRFVERNTFKQSITLVSSRQRYIIGLKHLSVCSACALAELTMNAPELKAQS